MLWSVVKQNINESFGIDMLYITFDKQNCRGYIVVDQTENQDKIKTTIQIDQVDFTIKRAEAQVLKEFWHKHGNHYSGILKKISQIQKTKLSKVTFMGVEYQDSEKLKQIFRNIMNSTDNN